MTKMFTLKNGYDIDYNMINVDEEWNESEKAELIMHTIHAYPAKFPAFIASKAFEYAQNEGVRIEKVADIFADAERWHLNLKYIIMILGM